MLSRCLLVASCAVLLVGLAGCSLPGSVPPTVKLGLSAPFEGLYRDLGYDVLHAVRLAVRERNDAGGLCGRYLVELVALNDLNESQEAVWQARELAADPGVMAVLGGWSASTAGAAAPEYERLGLPFLAPPFEPGRLGEEAAGAAAALGARRAAILSGPDAADVALADAFGQAWAAAGATVAFRSAASGQAVADALAARPDVLFLAADAPQAAEWIGQARAAGFTGPVVGGPGLGSPLLVAIAGQAAEGARYVTHYPPVPADPAFAERYQALSGGAPPGPPAAWAYNAARQLLDEIEQIGRGTGALGTCRIVRRPLPIGAGRPEAKPAVYVYVVTGGQVFRQP